ncbi:hypothetical protein BO70DRAFT_364868 [Aspergillus heteromorphus CBS 117.55]|uniref:Uncharacterized protein n=1 Tax=Aspergillus heteromorphus CBS 117.55 TaxID=1448321 RepID=A0A317VFW5_9EURO|nr:uncharacterized protein BO70DRAFT_364868 [Aspergillus heteromorphus CBS 117.55]PWY72339.1 hypothetical protein BO70DRAFT_364868 [Aspergillus heteromorphus CBS 117.55]
MKLNWDAITHGNPSFLKGPCAKEVVVLASRLVNGCALSDSSRANQPNHVAHSEMSARFDVAGTMRGLHRVDFRSSVFTVAISTACLGKQW